MIDLHVHTNASDGSFTPREVVRLAADRGIRALAITDHDTVAGLFEAQQEGANCRVEIISGVELSVEWPHGILHVLGYFVDTHNTELISVLGDLKRIREERTPKILAKLRDLDVLVSQEEVHREAAGGVPGRTHLARILLRKGYVSNMQEAFDRYLRKGAAAYVRKPKIDPDMAFRLIIESGGLPVLAHPYTLLDSDDVRLGEIVRRLASLGLAGIEVYYPKHRPDQTAYFLELAGIHGSGGDGWNRFSRCQQAGDPARRHRRDRSTALFHAGGVERAARRSGRCAWDEGRGSSSDGALLINEGRSLRIRASTASRITVC